MLNYIYSWAMQDLYIVVFQAKVNIQFIRNTGMYW